MDHYHQNTFFVLNTKKWNNNNKKNKCKVHCAKSARIRSFSGPYFSTFGLNKERKDVNLSIQSDCRKIWTRKTTNADTFHAVVISGPYSPFLVRLIYDPLFQRKGNYPVSEILPRTWRWYSKTPEFCYSYQ